MKIRLKELTKKLNDTKELLNSVENDFDADALGSGSQVALAQLSPGLHLTNQDFIVSWV
jgi:nanoRNase/pAp phosphatase (c-di-AMP/oligoRNAs hydrolase)